ncbi:RidA family protein [Paenibacillus nasutitermitis]|uniref:Endoribonuclease L-PSP/chorismate mutase-like domain-containing protein n=1 Tax=Paenibacillus nasutitermitis TaxID=1652958 RepID=A0A916ZDF1_9BACL|nr:RidA family protein [Paenibacillus nasutitermitis]GGD89816.1 hypothetical protein GCM10010911_55590 [Paenibacillus nasutitermitis]
MSKPNLIDQRLEQLGIKLSHKNGLQGRALIPIQQHGRLIYTSGFGPTDEKGVPLWTGRVGSDLTLEEGYQAARVCGIVILGQLQAFLGSLDRIDGIVKVLGLVSSAPDFYQQPQVMHGFSDLMIDLFGEHGKHTRSAMGTFVLPNNIPVEIEAIFSLKQEEE